MFQKMQVLMYLLKMRKIGRAEISYGELRRELGINHVDVISSKLRRNGQVKIFTKRGGTTVSLRLKAIPNLTDYFERKGVL